MFGPSAVISALQTGATGPNLEHNLFCNNSRTACYIFKKTINYFINYFVIRF